MEEIDNTNHKYQPLQFLWHPFVCPHSKNHLLFTHSLIYYTNSTFILSTIINLKLVDIHGMSFLCVSYKRPPSTKNIFMCASFFSNHSTFIFITHFSGACVNLRSISLFIHSICSPITHSFLNGFQPSLYRHFSHVAIL